MQHRRFSRTKFNFFDGRVTGVFHNDVKNSGIEGEGRGFSENSDKSAIHQTNLMVMTAQQYHLRRGQQHNEKHVWKDNLWTRSWSTVHHLLVKITWQLTYTISVNFIKQALNECVSSKGTVNIHAVVFFDEWTEVWVSIFLQQTGTLWGPGFRCGRHQVGRKEVTTFHPVICQTWKREPGQTCDGSDCKASDKSTKDSRLWSRLLLCDDESIFGDIIEHVTSVLNWHVITLTRTLSWSTRMLCRPLIPLIIFSSQIQEQSNALITIIIARQFNRLLPLGCLRLFSGSQASNSIFHTSYKSSVETSRGFLPTPFTSANLSWTFSGSATGAFSLWETASVKPLSLSLIPTAPLTSSKRSWTFSGSADASFSFTTLVQTPTRSLTAF